MNFKYFIIGIYLLFVGLIVMMVLKSCNQKVELETKNYYNEELKFQEQIDAKLAGNAYADSFAVSEKDAKIYISQPESVKSDSIVLKFTKPDDQASDTVFVFKDAIITPIDKLLFKTKGIYNLSIRMYQSGKPMLIEKKIKL
jgi:hypothetical protein